MNSAIASNPLFSAMFNDNEQSLIAKHTATIISLIKDKGLTIFKDLSDEEDSVGIRDIISNYIRKTLTKNGIDAIICEYGISKAMKLFHDFQKIGLNSPYLEICEILADEDYGIEREIIELIFNDAIGFECTWRSNGDGKVTTQEEIITALTAHSIACA
jgi:hypothetical protein